MFVAAEESGGDGGYFVNLSDGQGVLLSRCEEGTVGVQCKLHQGKAGGCANRVILGVFDVVLVDVPVFLVFITDHGKHLRHGIIGTLHAMIAARVIGACREFVTPNRVYSAAAR